jgi:hypothetical protein
LRSRLLWQTLQPLSNKPFRECSPKSPNSAH